MSNTKISVIVPVYNAEKYLATCIKSVLNQTFKDFELLLVDDCSTDAGVKIAEGFDDERIKILHTEKNSGNPGFPRNVGLDNATGEYVYFMDNDDAILPQALEKFLRQIEETGADVVYCNNWIVPNDPDFTLDGKISGKPQSTPRAKVGMCAKDVKQRVADELLNHSMHSVAWLCLYRASVFNEPGKEIRFGNCLAEDVFVHLDVLCKTDKIFKFDDMFYLYRENRDSLTRSGLEKAADAVAANFSLSEHIREKLTPFCPDDKFFVDEACRIIFDGVAATYLLQPFQTDPEGTLNAVEKALTEKFGGNSSELRTLAHVWLKNRRDFLTCNNRLAAAKDYINKL